MLLPNCLNLSIVVLRSSSVCAKGLKYLLIGFTRAIGDRLHVQEPLESAV